jgi:hypothetical protein
MERYFIERDGYSEDDPNFEERWRGANMARASKLMTRNGGCEDLVTMVKLGAGKRWDISRHNPAKCVLCEEEFSDQRHAMMACTAMEVHNARELWKSNTKALIGKAGMNVRVEMDEYYRNVFQKPDGEMAAVGTYTVRWVDGLDKGRMFNHVEWKAMLGLMKSIAQGARGVMRVFTRACCDKARGKADVNIGYTRALELRQPSICEFVGQKAAAGTTKNKTKNKKRGKNKVKGACEPPNGSLIDIERGGLGLVRWDR